MDEGRRKELEKLFIMDLDDAWRTRLSPEEALLIALWDRQFAEAKLRLQQGENRKASQRASFLQWSQPCAFFLQSISRTYFTGSGGNPQSENYSPNQ